MPQVTRRLAADTFDVDQLERAFRAFRTYCDGYTVPNQRWLRLYRPDEQWEFDEFTELVEELRRAAGVPEVVEVHDHFAFRLEPAGAGLAMTLRMPSAGAITEVRDALGTTGTGSPFRPAPGFKVFLGHGRNLQWRVLADHLASRHGFTIVSYESEAEVGQPASDVLAAIAREASFALLLHTAEVIGEGNTYHAGANVIHETGFFQARLGTDRALILREENCHPFANVAGLTELRFRTGAVQEIFGEVVAILRQVESANARSPSGPGI